MLPILFFIKRLSFGITALLFIVPFVFARGGVDTDNELKGNGPRRQGRGGSNFMDRMEQDALNELFVGVSTSAGIESGLFQIENTGKSTESIMIASNKFLDSLNTSQKNQTQFDIKAAEWRKWSNVDNGIYAREGISIKEMTQNQRKLAFAMLQESLSIKGLKLAKDIMKTDQTLSELNNNSPTYDEELYFITVMGTPSLIEPWGWQIEGHHLAINYFILGNQVVMTPVFMGAEPVITTSGKYKGNTLFQDEQNLGLKLMQSLTPQQQKQAIISTRKLRNNAVGEAFSDNIILDYEGLSVAELSVAKKDELLQLAEQYISNMRDEHAQIKMEEVRNHIDETWFSWVGGTDNESVFYYRIHSPVVLIEFDHQASVGLPGSKGQKDAIRNHIHTVVRTPNGNDYGKNLLKQHLEKSHGY